MVNSWTIRGIDIEKWQLMSPSPAKLIRLPRKTNLGDASMAITLHRDRSLTKHPSFHAAESVQQDSSHWSFGLSPYLILPMMLTMTLAVSAFTSADDSKFVKELYPALLNAQCNLCHSDNGVASDTGLEFPDANANDEQIAAFGFQLLDLIDSGAAEQTWLYVKPTNIEEHAGGERIRQGSEQSELLLSWIRYLQSLSEAEIAQARESIEKAKVFQLQPLTLRRLTHTQYNHAVRDLLGDLSQPANDFPPEDFVGGFKNQMAAGRVSPLQAEAYGRAAERLAARAFRRGDTLGLPPEIDLAEEAGVRKFVRHMGLRTFRRPLLEEEIERYLKLFQEAAAVHGEIREGGSVVIEAMLQSPSFLFQMESGPDGPFNQYELASRLALFLWDTIPNDELLRQAAAGSLHSKEQVEVTARKMLEDPRAKSAMEEFLAQWMRFDRVLNATRDRRKYRNFTPELAASMVEETRQLFDHIVWEDQNFMEFFTADYTYVSSELAELYGLPKPEAEFGRVAYPAAIGRSGVLGHASFLVATSKPAETSPTERGLFVRNHFLGQTVPAPPPGVNTVLPEITDDQPMTNRDRLAIHLNSDACAGCHRLIDPIGMGFEQYNAIGVYEPTLESHTKPQSSSAPEGSDSDGSSSSTIELTIDSSGYIQGIPESEFSTPKELSTILINSDACQRCIVKQLFRYTFGRQESYQDQPTIDNLLHSFRESDFRFRELLVAIVTSDLFLQRETN